MSSASARRRRLRLAVVGVSVAAAIAGSFALATYGSGESATTRGVAAILPLSGHPGAVAAAQDGLWIALSDTRTTAGDLPLLHLDLAGDALVGLPLFLGGRVTHLSQVGDRLLASVDGRRSTSIVAVDWRNGDVLSRRDFQSALGPVVRSGDDLWALQLRPAALRRFDLHSLEPNATLMALSTGRAAGLAAGAGYLWVSVSDAGDVLRIDPARRTIARAHVGGSPAGLLVADGLVWVVDEERGRVDRLDPATLEPAGRPIDVGGKPFSLARAGGYLFVGDAAGGTVTKIDLSSAERAGAPIRIASPSTTSPPFAVVSAGDSVWVSSYAAKTVTRVSGTRDVEPAANSVPAGRSAAPNVLPLPVAGRVVASISVPQQGGAFVVGEGAVWAMSDTTSTLLRIDPERNAVVARIKLAPADDAAAGDGAVWLTHPSQHTVTRLDSRTNTVAATIRVPGLPAGVAVAPGAVWVADPVGPTVMRIDPATNRVVAKIRVGGSVDCCSPHMGLAVSREAVWAALPSGHKLVRIDPRTDRVVASVKVDFVPCGFLVADSSAVWSAGADCTNVVARLDARTRRVSAELAAPHAVGLARAFGSIWVASLESGNVDRVDPSTARTVARLHVGGYPVRLGIGFGSVWVNDDLGRVLRIQPQQ